MFRRPFAALVLAASLAAAGLAPALAAGKTRPTSGAAPSPSPSPAASANATPLAAPTGGDVPAPSASPAKEPAANASAAADAATAHPRLGRAAPFVYLRDRYRRDDQGAALRTPIAKLAGLDYLLGTWSAHIFTLDQQRRVTHDFGRTTYVFARTLGGRWILGTDAKNTEFLYFTYDPVAKHWVYNDIKGFPSYGFGYATGAPHRLVFDSVVQSALGDERRLRTTLTWKSPKHFTLLDEEETPGDLWTPVVEFDYSRA